MYYQEKVNSIKNELVLRYKTDEKFVKFNEKRELERIQALAILCCENKEPTEVLAAVIYYSIVVLEAQKEHLDWRKCSIDYKIPVYYSKYNIM